MEINKTNKTIFLIIMIMSSILGLSQSSCETDYAIYRNEYKQKNYEEALKSWRKVYNNCPTYNQNTFVNGPKLYYDRIKNDENNKQYYIDTIMNIYDDRIKYFGGEDYILGLKGSDLLKYSPELYLESYVMLRKSVTSLGNKSNPEVILSYFKSLDKTQRNSEEVTKQDVLDAYIILSDIISYNINNNSKYSKYYEIAQTNIENIFAPYASCEDLVLVFGDRLNSNFDDIEFLRKITLFLDKKDCTENEVFFTAVEQLHKLSPTSSSSYDMGNNSLSKKNYSESIKYFNQAIELEEDIDYKASYYLRLAYAYQMTNSFSKARSAALSAAELKPEWGEPYLIIGDIYVASSSSCGSTNLERRSVFWLAVDSYRKAKNVDNLLSEKADKKISTWSKQFPSKEDCIWEDLQSGDSYKVSCWSNKSVKVRTRD